MHTEFTDRPTIMRYEYTSDGLKAVSSDRNGRELLTYQYSGKNLDSVDLECFDLETGREIGANLSQVSSISKGLHDFDVLSDGAAPKSQVGRFELERDTDGLARTRRFQKNGASVYVCNADGVGGFRYKLDELGRVVELVYLDETGNERPSKSGIARRTYRYDGPDLCETRYLGRVAING